MIKNFIFYLTLKCKEAGRYNESCYFFASTFITFLICLNIASLLLLFFKENSQVIGFSKSDYFILFFFGVPIVVYMILAVLFPKKLLDGISLSDLKQKNTPILFFVYLFSTIFFLVIAANIR